MPLPRKATSAKSANPGHSQPPTPEPRGTKKMNNAPTAIAAPVAAKKTYRTITMTGRRPVRICNTDWPCIADATDHDGQIECQANTEWYLPVRQHADGRAIVYGACEAGNGGQYASFRPSRAGEMLAPGDDIAAAIHRVAVGCDCECIADECVADLPAESI